MERTGTSEPWMKLFLLYLDSEKTDRDFSALFHQKFPEEKPERINVENDTAKAKLQLYDAKEVMELLRITPKTLYNWRQKGKLKGSFIGGKYLYKKQDVEKIIG